MHKDVTVRLVPASSYVSENTHPDCLPSMRFRADLPGGRCRWFGTREEAEGAVVGACGQLGEVRDAGQ